MAITIVQSAHNSGTGSSGTVTFASNVTTGNCVVLAFLGFGTSVTIGGSADNWFATNLNSSDANWDLWADPNAAGGHNNISISFLLNSAWVAYAWEVTGLAGTDSGIVSTHSGTGSPWTSNSVSMNAGLAVGACQGAVVSGTGTLTGPSSPWVNVTNFASEPSSDVAGANISGTNILSSTGSVAYAGTANANIGNFNAWVYYFAPSSVTVTLVTATNTIVAPAPAIVKPATVSVPTAMVSVSANSVTPQVIQHLIASIAAVSGSDGFGNTYQPGVCAYTGDYARGTSGGQLTQLFNAGLELTTVGQDTPSSVNQNATGGELILSSGKVTGADVAASVTIASQSNSSTSGVVTVTAGSAVLPNTTVANVITLKNGSQTSTITGASGNGHSVFSKEIELTGVATPSTPSSAAKVFSDVNGVQRVIDQDGLVYTSGPYTQILAANQTISLTSATTITDGTTAWSFTLAALKYHFRARIVYKPSGTAGTPNFVVNTPASSTNVLMIFTLQYNGIASGFARGGTTAGANTFVSVANTTAGSGAFVSVDIEGTLTASAGTLSFQTDISSGGSNHVIQAGSFVQITPV